MASPKRGLRKGLTAYGDEEFSLFLRKAFVTLNPQAFPSGAPHQMRTGTILQVPSMAALRQMLLAQHPASVALLNNVGGPNAERAATQQDSKEPKRWVRFP